MTTTLTRPTPPRSGRRVRLLGAAAFVTTAVVALPTAASAAAPYPSDATRPDLVQLLQGYNGYWQSDGTNDLHGTVTDAAVLQRDDQLTVWINQHATAAQKFTALQDAEYQNATGTAYDQSVTIATGLGSILGPAYVQGRQSGALPLTSALINSSNGSTGAYVGTGTAKATFSHPRPYLPSDPHAAPVAGDAAACAPSLIANASSQQSIRAGRPWADAQGNLDIDRVAPVTDTTHQFSPDDVTLDAGYGTAGICLGGSFPSGHTTTAYQAGITLATLLPELAPEILARTSEAANDRIVLGVHYPLDIMGGRIAGEAALATRWSDATFRTEVLEPARAELLAYFQQVTGHDLAYDMQHDIDYRSNPYGGAAMPGGSPQIVDSKRTATDVYTERLTYGFPTSGTAGLAPSVPAGASNLLLTTFPTLTDAQRTQVLALTEIASGHPLDQSQSADGSWERLNLAAAMSATVQISPNGKLSVINTGTAARVIDQTAHR